VLASLTLVLELHGFRVVTAENGERGLQAFRKHAPTVVVTDIMMPERDGIGTMLQMRRERPDVKIIAISGGGCVDKSDYLSVAEKLGAIAAFEKTEVDALVETLDSTVRRQTELVWALQWTEDFAVGHQLLDTEHRCMVELINDVFAAAHAKSDRQPELLDLLGAVTTEHIRHENAILWELRQGTCAELPGRASSPILVKAKAAAAFDEHMAEHEKLIGQFYKVRSLPTDELCETLQRWFLDHATRHDAHLRAIFQATPEASNAAYSQRVVTRWAC
jgi:CheY-like chemotaxis protein/hemerythrin